MKIIIIAAVAKNGVIGNQGKLCWHIPEDMRRFRELTTGHVVVFGRKTWEGLPKKPLPDRLNIIMTRNYEFYSKIHNRESIYSDNCLPATTESDLFNKWHNYAPEKDLYICGGSFLYREFVDLADELQLTFVNQEPEGDIYFPQWDRFKHLSDWDADYEFITVKRG